MIKIVKQGGTYNSPVHELVMDNSSEVADLPVNIPVGSTAYAIDTGETYMLNSTGEWNLMISKGGGGGAPGLSAYELWIQEGNQGTIEDFLESLRGSKGDLIIGDYTVEVNGTDGLGIINFITEE